MIKGKSLSSYRSPSGANENKESAELQRHAQQMMNAFSCHVLVTGIFIGRSSPVPPTDLMLLNRFKCLKRIEIAL